MGVPPRFWQLQMAHQLRKCLHVHDVALGRVVRAAHDGLCVGCHLSSPFAKVRGQTLPADHMVFCVRVVNRRHHIQVIDGTGVGMTQIRMRLRALPLG
jgi:hypothetical protein